MAGRVTFNQMNSLVQSNLMSNFKKMDKLQGQLSSGQRITRPSDAPVDITNSLELRSNLRELEQYQRNMDDGLSYLTYVDTTINGATDLMQSTRERALQGANDTYTELERRFQLSEVRVLLDQMVALGNSNFKGSFVFSGKNSQTPPYEIMQGQEIIDDTDNTATNSTDTFLTAANLNTPIQIWDRQVNNSNSANGNAKSQHIIPGSLKISGLTEGTDYSVDYMSGTITFNSPGTTALAQAAGTGLQIDYQWVRRNELDFDGVIHREMEPGVLAQMNTTASEVFGGPQDTTHWDAFISLMEGMHENDSQVVRQSIGLLDQSMDRQLAAQATNGARVNRFEATQNRGNQRIINVTETKSLIEDLDFAKTISEFLLQQSVYDASLASGSRVIQNSLVDYL